MTMLIRLSLGSLAAPLFILAGFVLLRVDIFNIVRLGIFDYCVHELTHVLDSSLEPAELVHQRIELAIPFQDNFYCLGSDSVGGVDYL